MTEAVQHIRNLLMIVAQGSFGVKGAELEAVGSVIAAAKNFVIEAEKEDTSDESNPVSE